jgi:hypothetical protein
MWRELIHTLEPSATYFPGASELQLAAVEQALGVALPAELRQLLLETNGVSGTLGLQLVWSTEEIIKRNLEKRRDEVFRDSYMPFDHLLFFADAGNGDQFAFPIIGGSMKRPTIFAWNHEDDSRMWVAPSLRRYLEWWLTGTISI